APGDPGHRALEGSQLPLDVERRRFTLQAWVGGQDHLPDLFLLHPLDELPDREVLRRDPVEGRESAAEHVILTAELPRALDRADVGRVLDHADECRVAPRVAADRAEILLGEVEAARAGPDLFRQRLERLRQPATLLWRLLEQMVGQSERRLPPDPREPGELAGAVAARR